MVRNALKVVLNIKFIAILIILQFSFGLYLINTSSITSQEAINKKKNLDRLFNFETTYLLTVGIYGDENVDSINNFTKVSKTYNELIKMKEEGIIKNNFLYYGGGVNPVAVNEKVLPEKLKNISYMSNQFAMIMVNDDFYNHYKLNITEGRGLTKEDFEIEGLKKNIPIILGDDYKETVKIGDVFRHGFPDFRDEEGKGVYCNFEVIGFYKDKDIPLLGGEGEVISQMKYSDAYGIFPIVKDIMAISYEPMISQYGIWTDVGDAKNLEVVQKRLGKVLSEDNFSLGVYSAFDEYKVINEILIKDVYNSKILGFTITILSIIGVAAIMVGRINERKKEFGIKISVGATINKLTFEVILENSIICLISVFLSIIFIYFNYKDYLSFRTILSNLIIIFIIIFIVNIMPILKLRKLNIVEIIRE